MKIMKYVSVDTEIEVNINPTDFLASIAKTPDSLSTSLYALNNIASILKAISDDLIRQLNVKQREIICSFLTEQASRYLEKL
jgi:hypothetical protein